MKTRFGDIFYTKGKTLKEVYDIAQKAAKSFNIKVELKGLHDLEEDEIVLDNFVVLYITDIKVVEQRFRKKPVEVLKKGYGISYIKYIPGTREDPPDEDLIDVDTSLNAYDIVSKALKFVLSSHVEGIMEDVQMKEEEL